ncbi:hypothetical protein KFK09_009758 [Dendrobium nobile]|uniref:Uncharacterized protein n=1 Tax=Dendrobium nobile TaxID=94219 RepID=A0A8T3BKM4_DENNO|nr:hypothetical protein KFK09_009758 [Dendrobium nobile]
MQDAHESLLVVGEAVVKVCIGFAFAWKSGGTNGAFKAPRCLERRGILTRKNDGNILMVSKEQLESSSTDEGSSSGSSTGGGTVNLKKGPWTTTKDALLISYVQKHAGLPLYPPKVNLQTSDENQLIQSASELSSGNKQNIGILPGTINGTLELRFLPPPYPPHFSDIPVTAMPSHGLGYYTSSFLNPQGDHVKQTWESETSFPGCHFGLSSMVPAFEDLSSLNSEPIYLNPGIEPGIPALSNGNFSSSKLLSGAVKMELPSLQSTEADYNDWNTSGSLFTSSYDAVDSYIQSPENVLVQSDCASPKNNGWFIGNSRSAIDSIFGPLGENLREDRAPVPGGISSMAWTNMPRV